jgi:hypothetical protein
VRPNRGRRFQLIECLALGTFNVISTISAPYLGRHGMGWPPFCQSTCRTPIALVILSDKDEVSLCVMTSSCVARVIAT